MKLGASRPPPVDFLGHDWAAGSFSPHPNQARSRPMIGKSDEITTLNTLTATLIDSVEGYRDAAANTESGRFQELFRQMANDRSTCCEDLRAEVRRLGGNPEDDQSTMGSLHQRWLDLKAAIT